MSSQKALRTARKALGKPKDDPELDAFFAVAQEKVLPFVTSAWLPICPGFLQDVADTVKTLASGVMLGTAYLEMFTEVPAMPEVVISSVAGFADQETSPEEDSSSSSVEAISPVSVPSPLSVPPLSRTPSSGSGVSPQTAPDEDAPSAPQSDARVLRPRVVTSAYRKRKDVPSQEQGRPGKRAAASPAGDPPSNSSRAKSKRRTASDPELVKATKPCESCKKSRKGCRRRPGSASCVLCKTGGKLCVWPVPLDQRAWFSLSCFCLADPILSQFVLRPAVSFRFSLPFPTVFSILR